MESCSQNAYYVLRYMLVFFIPKYRQRRESKFLEEASRIDRKRIPKRRPYCFGRSNEKSGNNRVKSRQNFDVHEKRSETRNTATMDAHDAGLRHHRRRLCSLCSPHSEWQHDLRAEQQEETSVVVVCVTSALIPQRRSSRRSKAITSLRS